MADQSEDLGLALLKYLATNTKSAGGPYMNARPFIERFLAIHGLENKTAVDIVTELVRTGYIGHDGGTSVQILNSPEGVFKERHKDDSFNHNITWKGKAFYLEHLEKRNAGVLSKWERRILYAVTFLTVVQTLTSVWQLCIELRHSH